MALCESYVHPRDEILSAIQRIYRYRMTTTSGGNLSILEENGDIWITPAGIDKGTLRREDIVCVHADGTADGLHRPSSELPFHQEIYGTRHDLRGIVHAHAVALVAFSLVHQVPDTRVFHQSRHVCGEAGFAPYELPGSAALGQNVASLFRRLHDCVILENHGAVTGGANLREAFDRFETLEFTAKTIIKARLLGAVRYLTDEQLAAAHGSPAEWGGFTHDAPATREKELRTTLAEFVRRAYRQRLFISTQGSFSARLEGDAFLITPYHEDRGTMEARDLVLVRGGECQTGASPSRAARIHAAVYRRYPEIGAIVNAYPVNATAFSVTGAELDSRTIPESYIVIRRVGRIPYGVQFEEPEAVTATLSPGRPAALLENDGVLVAGRSVLEAYDRLEVLESTAEAIVNCHALGTLAPMPEAVTRELERVFL
ncbi:MAG TPA: class II aldolase/adducin family protein [Candidatus Acidoferrales bacterium]|nr:class II aldolase/adducin family protein [Candidatus Acidoferrales bacterium]